MVKKKGSQILDEKQAERKIERMAYEIWENNSVEKEIVIAGIASRGFMLAEILSEKIREISSLKVDLVEVKVNKKDPFKAEPEVDRDVETFRGKSIIVVDDVLNSGRTLLFALGPFLKVPVKCLSVATLLNRSYRNFPVQAKYVGTSLSTTLQEHIEVEFTKKGGIQAFLQ